MADGFRVALLGATVLGGVLRFSALDSGLPHPMTRPDEEVILTQTRSVAQGQLDLGWVVYPSAYVYLTWAWGAAGLAAAERLGVVPEGSYLEVVARHPERVLLIDRVLSAAAGTATVPLLMLVVWRALATAPAIVAGAVMATNLLHVRDCHAVKPDALMVLFEVAAFGAMIPLARRATLTRGAAAGALVGLATSMKYPAVLLLLPTYLAAVFGTRRDGWRRWLPGPGFVAIAVAAALFVATSPYLLLSTTSRRLVLAIVGVIYPQLAPAPDPALAALAQLDLPRKLHWWEGLVYHARFSLWYGAGIVPTLLFPVALVWGLIARSPLPFLAAVFALVYYGVAGLSPMMLARYATPLVPVLALLEGGVLAAAARRTCSRRATVALTVATVLVVGEPLGASIALNRIAAQTDTRVLATEWMAAHLAAGTRVGVVGTHFWPYGVPRMPPGIGAVNLEPTPAGLNASRADYVLTHDHVLFTSRVDERALASLAPRLRLLAEFDPFVGQPADATFEALDAYYVPISGFGAVSRPGPRIRVYAVMPD